MKIVFIVQPVVSLDGFFIFEGIKSTNLEARLSPKIHDNHGVFITLDTTRDDKEAINHKSKLLLFFELLVDLDS
jgi:hypothetical protein